MQNTFNVKKTLYNAMAEILKKGKKSKEIIYGPHDFNGFGFDFWLK